MRHPELVSGSFIKTMKKSYVNILSNENRNVLYIGVTSELKKRILSHKNKEGSEFTRKYRVYDLIYFEEFSEIKQAIGREKQQKNWHREWKWNLKREFNPSLKDLYSDLEF